MMVAPLGLGTSLLEGYRRLRRHQRYDVQECRVAVLKQNILRYLNCANHRRNEF